MSAISGSDHAVAASSMTVPSRFDLVLRRASSSGSGSSEGPRAPPPSSCCRGFVHRAAQVVASDFLQQFRQVEACRRAVVRARPAGSEPQREAAPRGRLPTRWRPVAPDGGAAKRVQQLADIARPGVGEQKILCASRKFLFLEAWLTSRLSIDLLQQVIDQETEVARPLTERRESSGPPRRGGRRGLRGSGPAAISSVSVRLVAAMMRTSTLRGLVAPRRTTSPS